VPAEQLDRVQRSAVALEECLSDPDGYIIAAGGENFFAVEATR